MANMDTDTTWIRTLFSDLPSHGTIIFKSIWKFSPQMRMFPSSRHRFPTQMSSMVLTMATLSRTGQLTILLAFLLRARISFHTPAFLRLPLVEQRDCPIISILHGNSHRHQCQTPNTPNTNAVASLFLKDPTRWRGQTFETILFNTIMKQSTTLVMATTTCVKTLHPFCTNNINRTNSTSPIKSLYVH